MRLRDAEPFCVVPICANTLFNLLKMGETSIMEYICMRQWRKYEILVL